MEKVQTQFKGMFPRLAPDKGLSPVEWLPSGVPNSRIFSDTYRSFSPGRDSGEEFQDLGLLQSREVFIKGARLWNDHPNWARQDHWTMLETGFGLGLNFLSTWSYWLNLSREQRPRRLTYVSIEQYPVGREDLLQSVKPWPELLGLAGQLCKQWFGLLPGFHRLEFEGGLVTLLLCIGDIESVVKELDVQTDAIFLDGHSPKVNPQMWSHKVLGHIAKTAKIGTTLSTWCVSGNVIRSLNIHGFDCKKLKGIGPKRHRLEATYRGQSKARSNYSLEAGQEIDKGRCAVIGAGLAGAFAAYSMAKRGWSVSVFDCLSTPSGAASSVPVGIFSTQLTADDNPQSKLTRQGARLLNQLLPQLLADSKGINWDLSGVLEVRIDSAGAEKTYPINSQFGGQIDKKTVSIKEDFSLKATSNFVPLRKKNLDPRGFALHGLKQSEDWYELTQQYNSELSAVEPTQADNRTSLGQPRTANPHPSHQVLHSKGGWVVPQALIKALLSHPNIKFFGCCEVTQIRPIPLKDSLSGGLQNESLGDLIKDKQGTWKLEISQVKAPIQLQTHNPKQAENRTLKQPEFEAQREVDEENTLNERAFELDRDINNSNWNHVIVANSFAASHLLAPLLGAGPLMDVAQQTIGTASNQNNLHPSLTELELTRGQLTWGHISSKLGAQLLSFPLNGLGTFMCKKAAPPSQDKSTGQHSENPLTNVISPPNNDPVNCPASSEMSWFAGSTFERVGEITDEPVGSETPSKSVTKGEQEVKKRRGNGKRLEEINAANLKKLCVLYPRAHQIVKDSSEIHYWEGFRCNTKNRLPWAQHFVGPDETVRKALSTQAQPTPRPFLAGLSVLSGLGAKGLSLAPLCAEVLVCDIHQEPSPIERNLSSMLKKYTL